MKFLVRCMALALVAFTMAPRSALQAGDKPVINPGGVVNLAGGPDLAPGAWASVYGKNLSSTTRSWTSADFSNNSLPTKLDGVSVMIDNRPAYVSYISPTMINAQVPDDNNRGLVQVTVSNSNGTSDPVAVSLASYAPIFATWGKYAAAQHADYSLVAPVGQFPGSSPAKAGELLAIYGVGFGPTNPARSAGQIVETAPLADLSRLMILVGGVQARVDFAGLVGVGLYQFNIEVPANLPENEQRLVARIAGYETQAGVFIPVKNEQLVPAEVINPQPETSFTASTVTFRWTSGSNVDQYYLAIGSSPGAHDLYNGDQSTRREAVVSGLPVDGRSVYVRLSSRFGDRWEDKDYRYSAFWSGLLISNVSVGFASTPNQGTVTVRFDFSHALGRITFGTSCVGSRSIGGLGCAWISIQPDTGTALTLGGPFLDRPGADSGTVSNDTILSSPPYTFDLLGPMNVKIMLIDDSGTRSNAAVIKVDQWFLLGCCK